MSDSITLVYLIAIVLIGAGLFAVITLTRKSGRTLNTEKYQSQWLTIENSLKKDEAASYQLAVLHADKLVDAALRDRGMPGKTMGERMKAAQNLWTNADHIWGAHKVRNRIAHEPDAHVTYEIAARSLVAFKQALKDLGAI
ncbi:MAG TPA: hypothetical protein VL362_00380 [Patescibacteria group bacterium]|jgi:hypothetical protein|nr:hypothetical protein [Patescibacteria group bacterium]